MATACQLLILQAYCTPDAMALVTCTSPREVPLILSFAKWLLSDPFQFSILAGQLVYVALFAIQCLEYVAFSCCYSKINILVRPPINEAMTIAS